MQNLLKIDNITFNIKLPYYNERAKLIIKYSNVSPNYLELPFCDVEIIKKHINDVLSKIEGLRFTYNEKKFCWEIEFGTKPIQLTVEQDDYKLLEIITNKKYVAIQAAEKAYEKAQSNELYEELFDFGEDEFLPPIPMYDYENGKWCRIIIYLSYDEVKNLIFVEFHRVNGDRNSFYPILSIIKTSLNDDMFLNWLKRSAYIILSEGVEYHHKNHIMKYLFDDNVKREICSFL
jgi:hypothetical protein